MHFIILCIVVGAIIMIPAVRQFVGKGCLLFIVGFLAIVGFFMVMGGTLSLFH